jgi:hypothetical protein
MMKIEVYLPDEIGAYAEDLAFFFGLMVRKLHTNRHKGTGVDLSPVRMLEGAKHEINEAYEAMNQHGQFEFAVECADSSNMTFLAAMSALQMTREQFKEAAKE